MSYNSSTGIITAPVSIQDVKECLGENTNDLGALIQSPEINKWSLHKPVICINNGFENHNTPYEENPQNYSNPVFGLEKQSDKSYDYIRPNGNGNYYRLTDFNGYNHKAVPPIKENENLGGKDLISLYNENLTLKVPFREGDIPIDRFTSLRLFANNDWYIGYYLVKRDNNKEYDIIYNKQVTLSQAVNDFVNNKILHNAGTVPQSADVIKEDGFVDAHFIVVDPNNTQNFEFFTPDENYGIQSFNVFFDWKIDKLYMSTNPLITYDIDYPDPDSQDYQLRGTPTIRVYNNNDYKNTEAFSVTFKFEIQLDNSQKVAEVKTSKSLKDLNSNNYTDITFGQYFPDQGDLEGSGIVRVSATFRGKTKLLFSGYFDGHNSWTNTTYSNPGSSS